MFRVIRRSTGAIVDVYDVKMAEDKTALFLTHEYEGWAFRPASRFRPVTVGDLWKEDEKIAAISRGELPTAPGQIICPNPEMGNALREAAEEGQEERLEGLCTFGPLTRMDDEGSV